jgi:aspartate/tyrosine/aromatic aminotransferase
MTDGRVNMCGLNHQNMDYVGEAIHDAVTNIVAEPKI